MIAGEDRTDGSTCEDNKRECHTQSDGHTYSEKGKLVALKA
jgi:hypothetical protein